MRATWVNAILGGLGLSLAGFSILCGDTHQKSGPEPPGPEGKADLVKLRALLKEQLADTPTWQKIALTPERWIDKKVALFGWLHFDFDPKGEIVGRIYLYESTEAMNFRLEGRSIILFTEEALPACESKRQTDKAGLLSLLGKCVRVEGTLDYPDSTFSLGALRGPLHIYALRVQTVQGIPEELLDSESRFVK